MTGERNSPENNTNGMCKTPLERDIERKLVKAVNYSGGMCPKFVSPGTNGVPDRIVLMPGGRMAFVEVKAPGRKPRPLQVFRIYQLRELGFAVYVLDCMEQIPEILKEIRSGSQDQVDATEQSSKRDLIGITGPNKRRSGKPV